MTTRLPSIDPRRFSKWRVFEEMEYVPDEWQALFHESKARNRLLACGTRVGKTFALTPEMVAAAIRPSPLSIDAGEWVGSRVWLVAPTYDAADKLFLPVAGAIKKHFPWAITAYRLNDGIVRLLGDGFVQRKSAENPESLVSEQLDAVALDEASRVSEVAKEQLKQRLITRDGWMASLSSPVPSRWFRRDFELGQRNGVSYSFEGKPAPGYKYAGRRVVFHNHAVTNGFDSSEEHRDYWSCRVPTHANTRLPLHVLKDWERNQPTRIFRQDALAEFMAAEGQVFNNVEARMTASRITRGVPGRRYVVGWDIARARDFSVLSAFDRATGAQTTFDRFQGPWDFQYDRVERFCRLWAQPDLAIDATGPGDAPCAEMQRRNAERPFAARIVPVSIATNAIKRALIEGYAGALDQGEVTLIRDPAQVQEHHLYEYRQAEATGIIRYGAPPGFHDDIVMADALAVHLLKMPMGTAAFSFG